MTTKLQAAFDEIQDSNATIRAIAGAYRNGIVALQLLAAELGEYDPSLSFCPVIADHVKHLDELGARHLRAAAALSGTEGRTWHEYGQKRHEDQVAAVQAYYDAAAAQLKETLAAVGGLNSVTRSRCPAACPCDDCIESAPTEPPPSNVEAFARNWPHGMAADVNVAGPSPKTLYTAGLMSKDAADELAPHPCQCGECNFLRLRMKQTDAEIAATDFRDSLGQPTRDEPQSRAAARAFATAAIRLAQDTNSPHGAELAAKKLDAARRILSDGEGVGK